LGLQYRGKAHSHPREVRTTANISRISAGSLPAGSIEFKVEENVIKGEKIVAITPDGL
jgi:hypothetical protein